MAKKHPTHPEQHVGHWMRFVAAHAVHALGVELAAYDVTAAEWPVLRDLFDREEQAALPSELATRLGLSRGTVSKLVARLTAKGLIDIYEDEMDGRSQVVALSPVGNELVPDLAATADKHEADFFGHLKPADRGRLLELLKEIAARRGLKSTAAE